MAYWWFGVPFPTIHQAIYLDKVTPSCKLNYIYLGSMEIRYSTIVQKTITLPEGSTWRYCTDNNETRIQIVSIDTNVPFVSYLKFENASNYGTIPIASVNGTIYDINGSKIINASISYLNIDRNVDYAQINYNTTSNNNGFYQIDNIPMGKYKVIVSKDNYYTNISGTFWLTQNTTQDIYLQRYKENTISIVPSDEYFFYGLIIGIILIIAITKSYKNN
jgi:hypothetical protein